MPSSEVTLILTDWTRDSNGKKTDLPQIPMNSTVLEVKQSVMEALLIKDRTPDSILLFIGSLHLEEDKVLKEYNRSNRTKLSVDVYERVDLKLRVKTLQHCGTGGCVCVPLWSFLCRQTIPINIPDHKTVAELKKRVAEELNDPNRYTAGNIKLTFKNQMLYDDKQLLKDVGLRPDSTLTLFVDCCYWRKSSGKPEEKREEGPLHQEDAKQEDAGKKDANQEDENQEDANQEGEEQEGANQEGEKQEGANQGDEGSKQGDDNAPRGEEASERRADSESGEEKKA